MVVEDDPDDVPEDNMSAPPMPHRMYSPNMLAVNGHRATSSRARESSFDSRVGSRTNRYSTAGVPSDSPAPPSLHAGIEEVSDMPIEVQRLAAEMEVAEAELKAARIKAQYLAAMEAATKKA